MDDPIHAIFRNSAEEGGAPGLTPDLALKVLIPAWPVETGIPVDDPNLDLDSSIVRGTVWK